MKLTTSNYILWDTGQYPPALIKGLKRNAGLFKQVTLWFLAAFIPILFLAFKTLHNITIHPCVISKDEALANKINRL